MNWINVNEKLPEKDKIVLIFVKDIHCRKFREGYAILPGMLEEDCISNITKSAVQRWKSMQWSLPLLIWTSKANTRVGDPMITHWCELELPQ